MTLILHLISHGKIQSEPSEHPVLLTEAPLNPQANREKAAEIFFETFNVPALYIQIQVFVTIYVIVQPILKLYRPSSASTPRVGLRVWCSIRETVSLTLCPYSKASPLNTGNSYRSSLLPPPQSDYFGEIFSSNFQNIIIPENIILYNTAFVPTNLHIP